MVLLISPRPLSLPLSGRNDELDLGRGDDALPPMVQTRMHVHVRSGAAAADAAARYHSDLKPVLYEHRAAVIFANRYQS